MARSVRSHTLETRSTRLKLAVAKKPIYVKLAPGIALGYRRNKTAGTWVARVADGRGGNWTKAIGYGDDFDTADGIRILNFWQAPEAARTLGRGNAEPGQTSTAARPVTVLEALDHYAASLKLRGGDVRNVTRVRVHLPAALATKPVALLKAEELRKWRDGL